MKTLNKRYFRLSTSVFCLRSSHVLILFTLYIILFPFSFISAQHVAINWQQCYGGSEDDYASDVAASTVNYLIAGGSASNNGDISDNHGEGDGWIVKINSTGDLLWERSYGGSSGEYWLRIIPTTNNYYYLLGSSQSSDGDVSDDPYPESTDFWIVKIDSLGNILWDRILGGNGLDQMWTGTATDDGGVVALGWTGSDDGDVSTYYGAYDMWMVKLNSEGDVAWDFTIGNNWFDYGQAIIQTSDGGFLVGGASIITGGGNLNCVTHGEADAVLVKLDAQRNIEWQQCYGGSDHDGITGLLEIDDGYVFVAYNGSNDGDISGWHGENDIWTVKIDFFGNIIWQKSLGGSRYEFASRVSSTDSGGFSIVGMTESHDGDVSGNHSLSEYDKDIWIVKLSSEGALLSQQCIGGEGDERLDFGVVKKSDNKFIIAGRTNYGPSFDVQCNPHGSMRTDYWVLEVFDTTVNITETPGDFALKVYPNPANDYIIFESPVIARNGATKQSPLLTITNTLGQQIVQLEIKDTKTVWDTRKLKPGVYIYKLEYAGTLKTGKVIIQH